MKPNLINKELMIKNIIKTKKIILLENKKNNSIFFNLIIIFIFILFILFILFRYNEKKKSVNI
jgi:ABC-type multidrug transport system permease subunit